MMRALRSVLEPFILALLGTVVLASLLPARGNFAVWAGYAADAGIVLLFFLHGAKLSREAIWAGARNWRLHLAVFAVTFMLFPLLGLGFAALPFVPEVLAAGLLFLTLLPSTVQSSIAFTAIARGNVAAAVCSASFSNLIGRLPKVGEHVDAAGWRFEVVDLDGNRIDKVLAAAVPAAEPADTPAALALRAGAGPI